MLFSRTQEDSILQNSYSGLNEAHNIMAICVTILLVEGTRAIPVEWNLKIVGYQILGIEMLAGSAILEKYAAWIMV